MTAEAPGWAVHMPKHVDQTVLDLLEYRSLPRAWTARWSADDRHPTIYDDAHGWLTAGQLEERSRRVAGRFRAAGLEVGDRLIVSAEASMDLVVAYVGALRAGLVVVPVNGAYMEAEVAHIVRDARPAGAIVDDQLRADWIRRASERSPLIVSPDVGLTDRDASDVDKAESGDPALICYTSGTTGSPKGAVLSHGNLLSNCEALRLAWRWTPEDRLVLALPLFHLHGLGVGLHGTLTAGGSVILRRRFDVGDVLDSARSQQATLFFGVPTMYARLAATARVEELSALRLCVSGSAPLPPDLFAAIADRGRQRILERYGMTETVMNVSNPHDGERRPGTVGFPLPGVGVRLETDSSQILLKGPNVMTAYWELPEATAAAFDPDGWFRTGDTGEYDADGYLRIVGRLKELIITGGYNVYPRELEEVLRQHPAVREVAVVGMPSTEWGQEVTAFVVPEGQVDPELLIAFAREHLARFKCPKVVHLIDELPRNTIGKVLKHQLVE